MIFEITTSGELILIYKYPIFDRHTALTLTKVNTYGLLYEWKGSDVRLKPLLLTGHQGLSVDNVGYTNATDTTWICRCSSGGPRDSRRMASPTLLWVL